MQAGSAVGLRGETTARQGTLENQGKSLGVRESTPGLGQCLREKEKLC